MEGERERMKRCKRGGEREEKRGREDTREREDRTGELLSSPFDRFQSTAFSATFSRGSPTISPSSRAKEWHVARTH